METCEKHPHEPGAGICGRCGGAWCPNCLVYAYGDRKPPLCMSCAMFAGGVRTAATRPAMPKRELKARLKAAQAETKARQARRDAEPGAAPAPDGAPDSSAGSSWDTPWWDESSSSEHTYAD